MIYLTFRNAEEKECMHSFWNHVNTIEKHNDLYEKGEASFKLSINKYSDIPSRDSISRMNGFKLHLR